MRKWILGVGVVSLVVASMAVAAPAGANHAPQGTVTVAGVERCAPGPDAIPLDGKCTWKAVQNDTGWVGVGPFKISWVKGTVTGSVTCPANTFCQTSDKGTNPVPAGSTVVSEGQISGGRGTFAAGDPDHD